MLARLLKIGALGASLAALSLVALSGDASADGKPTEAAKDAGAPDTAKPPNLKIPPDPTPLTEREQWVFDLRWDRGDIFLLETHKTDMGGPHTTARVMGRFALELYEGPTLIERVRFDFPMLGAGEADAGRNAPPSFEPKLKTRIGVLFPATKRGTRLELWDRARDVRMPIPWPPKEGALSPDGGG